MSPINNLLKMNTNTNTNTLICPVVLEMQRSFPHEWYYRIFNTPFDTQLAQKLREDKHNLFIQQQQQQSQLQIEIEEVEDIEVEQYDDDYDEDMERAIARECFKRRLAAEARKNPRKKCKGCNMDLEPNNLGVSCVKCIFALNSNTI